MTSIAGNQNFTQVRDTLVDATTVQKALLEGKALTPASFLQGYITPTAVGGYAVVDANGVQLAIPDRSMVTRLLLSGSADLAGGTSVVINTATVATPTTAATALSGVVVTATLLLGVSASAVVPLLVPAGENLLQAQTLGVYTAGTISVIVEVVNA